MDDSYFGSSAAGKRGRGAANKSTVVIAVENRGTAPGYAAIEVVDSMHSSHIRDFAFRHIEDDQTIKTDKYPSYNVLDVAFYHHGEVVSHG